MAGLSRLKALPYMVPAHMRSRCLREGILVVLVVLLTVAGASVDAFAFTSAASRSYICPKTSSRASFALRSTSGRSNDGFRGRRRREVRGAHRSQQPRHRFMHRVRTGLSMLVAASAATASAPSRELTTATEVAAQSGGAPYYDGDVIDHRIDTMRLAQHSTNEFLSSQGVVRSSAAAATATAKKATTSIGTSIEWSRAAEIARVVGGTMYPILASWIRTRAFPSSSGDDADFWSLRSGFGNGGGSGNDSAPPPTHAERVTMALEELGCTFVKFGQALSSRPDVIPPTLASALAKLRDRMEPFDSQLAIDIVRRELSVAVREINKEDESTKPFIFDENGLEAFLASFSDKPVAAASIGQVYRGRLAGFGPVAVKVRRLYIEQTVKRDAELLRGLAQRIERFSQWYQSTTNRPPLVQAKLSDAVDEFMGRIYEELDYRHEAQNLETFASLYSSTRKTSRNANRRRRRRERDVRVVVPDLVRNLCTENVLVMEWLDGTKLVDDDARSFSPSLSGSSLLFSNMDADEKHRGVDIRTNLALVETGIQCTLSQLLDTGILHADPHAGNLLKVPRRKDGSSEVSYELGYLDFGLISTVPSGVRDGLVCAVSQLVFARSVDKVAQLFGDLQLLPDRVMQDPHELRALTSALDDVFERVLDYSHTTKLPNKQENSTLSCQSNVPILRFDNLLSSLAGLVTRFEFRLPPYFLNNARALGTLEGIAKSLDPNFNVLRVVYPYALDRLLANPSNSPVVEKTLMDLVMCPKTGRIDSSRVARLLDDSASLTGYSRRRVVRDVLTTRGGRRFARRVLTGVAKEKAATALRWGSKASKFVPSDYFKL